MTRVNGLSAVAALLLLVGCAGMNQGKKSDAVAAQDSAQGQFQQAANAQQAAKDEQNKAEAADRDVVQKQKELADAQTRARGQELKAQQAQQEAARSAQMAQQAAAQSQASAGQLQQQQFAQQAQQQQQNQNWTQRQHLDGKIVNANSDSVQVIGSDQKTVQLGVNDSTAILQDGHLVKVSQLAPGSDVRASYQVVDGKAKALRIEATSNAPASIPEPNIGPQNNMQPSH